MEKTRTVAPAGQGLLVTDPHTIASDMAFLERQKDQHERACEGLRDLGPMAGFFGGARYATDHLYYASNIDWAEAVCRTFRVHGLHGGGPSLMEATGIGARRAGFKSVGLCLTLERFANGDEDLDVKVQFEDFGPRIDAFLRYGTLVSILFPGGAGTLHELFAILDNLAKGKTRPRPVLLAQPVDDTPYWSEFLAWYDGHCVGAGAVSEKERQLVQIVRTKEEAIARIAEFWGIALW